MSFGAFGDSTTAFAGKIGTKAEATSDGTCWRVAADVGFDSEMVLGTVSGSFSGLAKKYLKIKLI